MLRILTLIISLAVSVSASAVGPFELSFTVDDLPQGFGTFAGQTRLQAAKNMIAALKRHGITNAYGFVNSEKLPNDAESIEILKLWIDAGFKLGNHTATHTGAIELTADQFIADVERTDAFLARLGVGVRERRMFRYPYLAEGNTLYKRRKIRDYLLKNGYRIAPVTVDIFDYLAQDKFDKARDERGRRRAAEYALKLAEKNLNAAIELSDQYLGRQVRHVALMHLLDLHGQTLDAVLTEFDRAGAEFVSVDRALQDPAYNFDHGQAASGMGSYFDELRYGIGEWTPDEDRRARYRPSTIQAHVARARAFAPTCESLFEQVMP